MNAEVITYIIAPIVTAVIAWISKGHVDEEKKRKEKMDALQKQDAIISSLYTSLATARETLHIQSEGLHQRFRDELNEVRRKYEEKLKALEDDVNYYKANCDCSEEK